MTILLDRSFVRTRITIILYHTTHAQKEPVKPANIYSMKCALHTTAASFKSSSDRVAWLIDSGSSDHIVSDLTDFID